MRDFLKICGCFGALFFLARVNDFSADKKRTIDVNQNARSKYLENTVRIHKHLFTIYRLSAHGKVAEADNLFEEVLDLWYARDVRVKSFQSQKCTSKYFPSDSLANPDALLEMVDEHNSIKHMYVLTQEIKRIQGRMDECDESDLQPGK